MVREINLESQASAEIDLESRINISQSSSLLLGLQAYWPTADVADVDLNDYSGNDLTLTNNNGVIGGGGGPSTTLPNATAYAALSSQFLSRADDPAFTPGDGFSVAIWAWVTSKGTLRSFITQRAANQNAFELAHEPTNDDFRFVLWGTAQSARVLRATTLGSPALNTWYHIVGTFDATTMRIYVNGVLDNSVESAFPIHDSTTGSVQIGAGASTNFHDGRLAHAALWPTRALSATEVAELYNEGDGFDLSQARPTAGIIDLVARQE